MKRELIVDNRLVLGLMAATEELTNQLYKTELQSKKLAEKNNLEINLLYNQLSEKF